MDPKDTARLVGLLIGTTVVIIFGLLDDRFQFSSRPQYLAQFASALLALAFMIFIERVDDPFSPDQVVFPWPVVGTLSIFWFMGMINTVNWLDGLDGLAVGVAAVVRRRWPPHGPRGPARRYVVSGCPWGRGGFLPFNFHPARAFMGSNGSYFLVGPWPHSALCPGRR